ncbi:hypothetical protein NHX12_027916 [Muraenolepis orangiensis]|uniref:Guanine nucleotide exchange factor VAV2 n=1 Tax=Muraenolepis orangiensis TaxID=630683 RepID=A0A9Q0EGF9_9TELE|nr:hypothetical protein NHX12_027916 [Muraenolepis orangiensis]
MERVCCSMGPSAGLWALSGTLGPWITDPDIPQHASVIAVVHCGSGGCSVSPINASLLSKPSPPPRFVGPLLPLPYRRLVEKPFIPIRGLHNLHSPTANVTATSRPMGSGCRRAFLCLKNIRTFLKVCHDKFGLRNSELFDPFDLFDVRDFGKVSPLTSDPQSAVGCVCVCVVADVVITVCSEIISTGPGFYFEMWLFGGDGNFLFHL